MLESLRILETKRKDFPFYSAFSDAIGLCQGETARFRAWPTIAHGAQCFLLSKIERRTGALYLPFGTAGKTKAHSVDFFKFYLDYGR
jgi:hypothetical protein